MSTIEFKNVTRVFKRDNKDFLTIDGFDLKVNDQEFVAIVGPSGCGKTTCMRMVAGLEFPSTCELLETDKLVISPGPERDE